MPSQGFGSKEANLYPERKRDPLEVFSVELSDHSWLFGGAHRDEPQRKPRGPLATGEDTIAAQSVARKGARRPAPLPLPFNESGASLANNGAPTEGSWGLMCAVLQRDFLSSTALNSGVPWKSSPVGFPSWRPGAPEGLPRGGRGRLQSWFSSQFFPGRPLTPLPCAKRCVLKRRRLTFFF